MKIFPYLLAETLRFKKAKITFLNLWWHMTFDKKFENPYFKVLAVNGLIQSQSKPYVFNKSNACKNITRDLCSKNRYA